MGEHPAIALYRQTADFQFPLVLVVGREPNFGHERTAGIGLYDFDEHSSCAFWNIAYRSVGKSASSPVITAQFKQYCRRVQASPIAFADALPKGICNEVRNKYVHRMAIRDAEIESHIEEIFSHSAVIKRTAILLISGIHTPEFSRSKRAIKSKSADYGIPTIDIAFLYGTNAKRIDEEIVQSGNSELKRVVDLFVARAIALGE